MRQKLTFVLSATFFLVYLLLGLAFIFIKSMPFSMTPELKVGFGFLLIAYSLFRLYRLIKQQQAEK